jgi:hypothetical protein
MSDAMCKVRNTLILVLGCAAAAAVLGGPFAPRLRGQAKAADLPDAVRVELLRLEETYRVLDRTATQVWPGWTNYRDFPFLFSFENGLRVLVGHPSPPAGYRLLADLTVAGKPVYIDNRRIEAVRVDQPLYPGGGISSLGSNNGRPVTIIDMSLGRLRPSEGRGEPAFRTEDSILTYIHELFHGFQQDHIEVPYPNFRYNPDTPFAAYSEIEGAALEKAYRARDPEESKRRLKDFLLARKLKRKGMETDDARCESADEVREGTAVYSEVRTLELLRSGFEPGLHEDRDPYYGGFKDIGPLLQKYRDRLHKRKSETYSFRKCYEYGCFQALLLERHFPGWQASFSRGAGLLDEEIAKLVSLSSEDERRAERRFDEVYGFRQVWARHQRAVESRDAAYDAISSRQGREYVISLKPIQQFLSELVGEGRRGFEMGLMRIFPRGVGTVKVDDIELRFARGPVEINQLYYFRVVDTDWRSRSGPYTIRCEKRESGDIFTGATLTTPLFVLKAPRIRVEEEGQRVKIWILARVS